MRVPAARYTPVVRDKSDETSAVKALKISIGLSCLALIIYPHGRMSTRVSGCEFCIFGSGLR